MFRCCFSRLFSILGVCLIAAGLGLPGDASAETKKPNILVIWGDDIGGFNISAYNQGVMGYKTPNIDSIAKEGALFTDWYGQQRLHRRPRRLHHRPIADSHRTNQGRPSRRARRHDA